MNRTKGHKNHWFSAFHWHFGPYGDQNVHVHSCCGDADAIEEAIANGTDRTYQAPPCDWALIGEGRDCRGKSQKHTREIYTDHVAVAPLQPRDYD